MTNNVKPEEKTKREDQGLFLQLPYILIDTLNMSDSASLGFIRFCRQCLQKDKTIRYSGSYRQLAAYIQQSRMTCYRSVEQWVNAGLVTKTETPDDFILTGNLSPLWSKNSDHCKTHQRPKLGQSVTSTASQSGTDKAEQRPKFSSAASQNKHSSVPNLDANEHENDPLYTVIDTNVDTFFSEGENVSCSQTLSQPTPEKKDDALLAAQQRIAELEQQLAKQQSTQPTAISDSSRLQEKHNNQSSNPTLFQETAPAESVPKVVFNDMTKDLDQKDVCAVTPAQQKRIDAAERKAEEKRVKERVDDLWRMAERIAGVVVRTNYAIGSVKAMAETKMPLEDIEIIMQKFADAGQFDLTPIANYLPKYNARKQRGQADTGNISQFPAPFQQPQEEVRRTPGKSTTERLKQEQAYYDAKRKEREERQEQERKIAQ